MRTATGIETLAYSNLLNILGIAGRNFPMATPATIHKITQIERYLSKKLICFIAICPVLHSILFLDLSTKILAFLFEIISWDI
jgi:hypothetical protein